MKKKNKKQKREIKILNRKKRNERIREKDMNGKYREESGYQFLSMSAILEALK